MELGGYKVLHIQILNLSCIEWSYRLHQTVWWYYYETYKILIPQDFICQDRCS